MARKKHPREDRFIEYLKAPNLSLEQYLRQRLRIGDNKAIPGNARKATADRHQRREEHYKNVYEKMQKDLEKDQAKRWKPDIAELGKIHKNVITIANKALVSMTATGEYKAMDVKKYREIIKTELGEPTSITKNENTNHDTIRTLDGLYDEPKEGQEPGSTDQS